MKEQRIEDIFEEAFYFLLTDYEFSLTRSKKENWGYELIAMNSCTGVEIIYEFREAFAQIILYKLVDGKIVKNMTNAIRNNEPITGVSLEWIIAYKNPKARIKPTYEYGVESPFHEKNGLKNYVLFVANGLKEYAGDVLNGDFSIFGILDVMIKDNYWAYYNKLDTKSNKFEKDSL